ncbi:MAG: LicD family protein [Lachnospiraceae bacterium]|nr:LicD family protein [Lachnospiraceae bacterium]
MIAYKETLIQNAKKAGGHEITDEELKKLQMCMLKCYREINDVCEKHKIQIFLQGGSLLGAVRHGGFIPWDDDMDFGMSRKDYNKFIQVFEEELSDRYILSAPNSSYKAYNRFIQLYRKDTVLIDAFEDSGSSKPQCVYIDIFPIDYAPNNGVLRQIKGIMCNFLMVIAGCVEEYKEQNKTLQNIMEQSKKGKWIYRIRYAIGKIFGFKAPGYWFNLVDKAISHSEKTGYVTSGTGRKHYLGEVVSEDVFFPLKYMKFEKIKVRVPNKPHEYLENLYGNYMKIPPEHKRERHFIKKVEVDKILK